MVYRVVKTIGGRRYVYEQESYRQRGRVRTKSRYIGPVEQVGDPNFGRRILAYLFSPRRDEDKGLEWAMAIVCRLTGRSIEDQLSDMEIRYGARQPTQLATAPAAVSTMPVAATAPSAPATDEALAPDMDMGAADAGGAGGGDGSDSGGGGDTP